MLLPCYYTSDSGLAERIVVADEKRDLVGGANSSLTSLIVKSFLKKLHEMDLALIRLFILQSLLLLELWLDQIT